MVKIVIVRKENTVKVFQFNHSRIQIVYEIDLSLLLAVLEDVDVASTFRYVRLFQFSEVVKAYLDILHVIIVFMLKRRTIQ